jgi:hypothetical protein
MHSLGVVRALSFDTTDDTPGNQADALANSYCSGWTYCDTFDGDFATGKLTL